VVSNLTTTVSFADLLRFRSEVCLLPVVGGFDGTRVPNGSGIASATTSYMTKNAGVAGLPGSPTWSHPV
jgi:hypothetical protein